MSEVKYERKRRYDNAFRELWEASTPWIQLIGFAFIAGGFFWQFQALAETSKNNSTRLTAVELNYAQINQKLDDVIYYLRKGPNP